VTFNLISFHFYVKFIANGTSYSYSYNGGLIESHTWSTEAHHFQWSWTTLNTDFKIRPYF